MTYRRRADPEGDKAWKKWIGENRDHLERIGLPLALYQDAAHWDDFLENGHLHWHDRFPFDFVELGRGQMEQLRAFLERHYPDKPPPLVGWLRVRLGKDPAERGSSRGTDAQRPGEVPSMVCPRSASARSSASTR